METTLKDEVLAQENTIVSDNPRINEVVDMFSGKTLERIISYKETHDRWEKSTW